MMTSGDIEFEPSLDLLPKEELPMPLKLQRNTNTKIFTVTTSIAVMTAGDAGIQAEILTDVYSEISKLLLKQPTRWIAVKEVVDIYVEAYNRAKSARARSMIYAPYGLDENSFIEKQAQMS